MANHYLHIVGTVHLDLKGKDRLDSVIAGFNPQTIALEMTKSREMLPRMVKENISSFVEGLKPSTSEEREILTVLGHYLTDEVIGYELKACNDYKNKKPEVELSYVDLDIVNPSDYINLVLRNLKQFFPMLTPGGDMKKHKKTLRLFSETLYFLQEIGAKKKLEDQSLIHLSEEERQTLKRIYSDQRNEVMAEKIRERYHSGNQLLAVVGLGHLSALESKLTDLNPTILT